MSAPNRLALLLALLLAAPCVRAAEPAPDANALLAAAVGPAAAPYRGRVTLTRWEGTKARSEEANVYFRPPNLYRMEFLTPAGAVDRVVLTDGSRREVQILRNGNVVDTDDAAGAPAALSDVQQRGLLLQNYHAAISGSERTLDRDAWILDLTPKAPGKPRERMLVDKATHVVLEVRRIGDNAGTTSQFTRFEPNTTDADSLFAWLKPAPNPRESGAALADAGGWPTSLPGGYALLSADAFEAAGQRIRQSRYSDGLSVLSVFVTSAPVQTPAAAATGSSPLELSGPDRVKQWRSGGRYFTAIGDVPPSLLSEIQQKID